MFLPPRTGRLPFSGRGSEAPGTHFRFRGPVGGTVFIFAAFLSSLCLSPEGSPFLFLTLRFISSVCLRFRDASTVGHPER